MENAVGFLKQLPANKEEITNFVQKVTNEVQSGSISALEVYHNCKCIEQSCKEIQAFIKADATAEAEKYKGQTFKNSKIEIRETGVKYDYSTCNDTDWNFYEEQINGLKKEQKKREAFLSKLTSPMADAETGVIINPPMKRTGGESLIITL